MRNICDWFRFQMMRIGFAFRDHFVLPRKVLSRVGVEPGQTVLDFGCGPGSYTLAAARLVGPEGTVWAADQNLFAIRHVERKAREKSISNVTTIHTNGRMELPDAAVDIILMFDVYHELDEPDRIRSELHRVLKPDGLLAFSDHHMDPDDIEPALTGDGLFRLYGVRARTYIFRAEP